MPTPPIPTLNSVTPAAPTNCVNITWQKDTSGATGNISGYIPLAGGTVLEGAGLPANTLGNNGDVYINTSNNTLYIKASGTWGGAIVLGGTSVSLEVNGTPTSTQSVLNLIAGTGMTITAGSGGNVTFQVSSYSGPANEFLATPSGASGTAALRAIQPIDIPTLNQNTTGSAGSVPASGVTSPGNLTESVSSVLTISGGSGATLTNTSIQVKQASGSVSGFLSSTDWTTFNSKQASLGFTPLNPANNLSDVASAATSRTNLGLGSAATQSTSAFDAAGAAATAQANAETFSSNANNLSNGTVPLARLPGIPATSITSAGNLSEATSSVLSIAGGTGAVLDNVTIQVKQASGSQSGYLSSTDWNTFNGKQGALGYTPLNPANNLSDVASITTARTNLGLGSAATEPSTYFLQTANNLSDVASASAARTNIGLGSAAVQNSSFFLQAANNLSDLASASSARMTLSAAKTGANSDITSLSGLTTPLSVAQGGSGSSSPSLVAGANISIIGTWPNQTIAATGSVLLETNGTANASQTTLNLVAGSGTTLTNAGGNVTISSSYTLPSGGGNQVLATPNGSSGVASLRALVAADIPSLSSVYDVAGSAATAQAAAIATAEAFSSNAGNLSSGLVAIARGGTGTSSPGLIAGTNVTITGSWPNQTINASGGGSSAFSSLTGGTNTSAAMVVGTGASLSVSGSGTIAATSLSGNIPSSQVTGLAASATTDTTVATNISSGTLNAARLPSMFQTNSTNNATQGALNLIAGTNVTLTNSGSSVTITASSSASTAFSALTGSTNTTAAMVVGSGASLTTSGSGTITATAVPGSGITGTVPVSAGGTGTSSPGLVAGTNVTITGSWPNQTINASGSGSSAFSSLTSGTNTSAAMVVGTGASLTATGSGTITATAVPASGITGILGLGSGGTGANVSGIVNSGSLLIGSGSPGSFVLGTLTAGTGISVTNGAGTITIAATGSGSSAFNAITSGTNTTAAMVVGSGASLTATGSGSITATAVPASGVTSGASLTEATSSVLTISGGSAALLNATTIQVKQSSGSQSGYLSSTDWTTFNNKQAALGYTPAHSGANSDITSLSGLTTPLSIAQGGTGSTTAAITAGSGISVSGTWPNVTITNTGTTSLLSSANVWTNVNTFVSGYTVVESPTYTQSIAVTPVGTSGSTSYSYAIVPKTADGYHGAVSSTGSTSLGVATLSGTNYNNIGWSVPSGSSTGAYSYDVYRLSGGGTTGKIGNVIGSTISTMFFADTGIVGDGTTPPSSGNAGNLTVSGGMTLGSPLPVSSGGTGVTSPSLVGGTGISISGTWPNQTVTATGSSTVAFSGLTSATNTTAAMVVGSGASLTISGSGTISATSVPATGISGTLTSGQLPSDVAYIDVANTFTAAQTINANLTIGPPGVSTGNLFCNGKIYAGQGATGSTNSALTVFGQLTTEAPPTPSAPSVTATGTTGSTTYSYKIATFSIDGSSTAASSATTITNGNSILSMANYNNINTGAVSPGFITYVYRTAGGSSQGLIAEVAYPGGYLQDTGLTASGSAPTTSNIGNATINGSLSLPNNPLAVAYGGSGSTSPSLVAGTGISISGSWPNQTITNSGASPSFASITSGTNGSAAMVIATGGSLTTSGSGSIIATAMPASGLTGTVPITSGGTGTSTPALVAGTGISISGSWPNQTITNTVSGGAFSSLTGGTNTTAAMVVGTGASLSVSGSGTISATTAGSVNFSGVAAGTCNNALTIGNSGGSLTVNGSLTLASPLAVSNGGTGTTSPGLVAGTNITITGTWPNQTINSVTGTVGVANGGTGLTSTPSNGQIPIGNGSGFSLATITAGSNVTVTNGSGTITIAASGGGGGGSTTNYQTGNYTALSTDTEICFIGTSTSTCTAPSSPTNGQILTITNGMTSTASSSLGVKLSGFTFLNMGSSSSGNVYLWGNNQSVTLSYNTTNSGWYVIGEKESSWTPIYQVNSGGSFITVANNSNNLAGYFGSFPGFPSWDYARALFKFGSMFLNCKTTGQTANSTAGIYNQIILTFNSSSPYALYGAGQYQLLTGFAYMNSDGQAGSVTANGIYAGGSGNTSFYLSSGLYNGGGSSYNFAFTGTISYQFGI